jgi:uncharacterized protein
MMARLPEVRMPGSRPFAPRVSGFTQPFWRGLDEGRLLSTRCMACGQQSFPPRNLCRACWSTSLEWVELPSTGRLYSFTRIHVAPQAFSSDAPYAIGMIDLEQGPRLMCRLIGKILPEHLGASMAMLILRYDDGALFGARLNSNRRELASQSLYEHLRTSSS